MIHRVVVDPNRCLATGLCVRGCPQVFAFRNDGSLGVVSVSARAAKYYHSHADTIRRAASCCPADAIRIEGGDAAAVSPPVVTEANSTPAVDETGGVNERPTLDYAMLPRRPEPVRQPVRIPAWLVALLVLA